MTSPYTRLNPISNIRGFVVNAYDATNYDIDLDIPAEFVDYYKSVIFNKYKYIDAAPDGPGEIQEGTTYRCRLKGIGTEYPSPSSPSKQRKNGAKALSGGSPKIPHGLIRESYIAMIRQIDRQNGWVNVTISDIDVYNRLLISLHDPVTQEDLSSILFSVEYRNLYCRYDHPNKPKVEEGESSSGRSRVQPTNRRPLTQLRPIPVTSKPN